MPQKSDFCLQVTLLVQHFINSELFPLFHEKLAQIKINNDKVFEPKTEWLDYQVSR